MRRPADYDNNFVVTDAVHTVAVDMSLSSTIVQADIHSHDDIMDELDLTISTADTPAATAAITIRDDGL